MSNRFAMRISALATAVAALLTPLSGHGETELSNQPLVLNVTAAPNVLMILDNSGSMAYEVLPDAFRDLWDYEIAMRRTASTGVYMPDYEDNNIFNVALRASTLNRIYYNPAVTYRPWTNADGSSYPQSPPDAAPVNPGSTSTMDLTTTKNFSFRWQSNTATTFAFSSSLSPASSCGGSTSCSKTFSPITFFVYKGTGSVYERANYYRYRIVGTDAWRRDLATMAAEQAVTSFTWNGGITRTIAEEKNNFANWFTYARTRMNAAKGGVSYAFSTLGQNYRVGFRTINESDASSHSDFDGVDPTWLDIPTEGTFSDTNRSDFFTKLFAANASGNTPLRIALKNAGAYFSSAAPWGPDVGGAPLSCRQSFSILTTDGYYNDSNTLIPATIGNADGTKGRPYSDTQSKTLADIAMYYYDTDLQPGIPNNVPTTSDDTNERQHMNTFGVSLGLAGALNPETDLPRLTSGEVSWPSTSSDSGKLDDLWHATVNGRGKFVSAADPQEFADGLKGALDTIVARTASSSNLGVSSTTLRQGSRVFQARFTSEVWNGDIWAFLVDANGAIPTTPNWIASEHIPAPSSRNIYTRNGGTGVPFTWASLSTEQQAALGNSSAVLDYTRGVRSAETNNGGSLRNRSSLIGDIVHSSPVFVAQPDDFGYERFSWPGASTYQDYRAIHTNREGMVYIAANDGLLHAFVASTGVERFAYVPSSSLAQLYQLSRPSYTHQFINDGVITVADVYDDGSSPTWRSVLVASTGRGGRQLYALDVTDPAIPATNAAARRVMWEYSDTDFGRFTGQPVVSRMNNGAWAVIVGNGYNSDQYRGFLFVINALTGELIRKIDTGTCPAGEDPCISNGLAEITPWDEDNDGDVDYIYAGDLRGNVWRFDVSTSDPASWRVSFGTDSLPQPLFRARDASGNPQAITSRIEVLLDPKNSTRWISFGTGKFLGNTDRASTAVQTWYGMYDNYANGLGTPPVSGRIDLAQRVVLVETTQTVETEVPANEEGAETQVTTQTTSVRVISAPGDELGGDPVTNADGEFVRKGWYLDLVPDTGTAEGERIIFGVQTFGGAMFTTTSIPANDPCSPGGSGWFLGVNPYTGGRLNADLFASRDKVTVTSGDSSANYYVSGVGTGSMPSSPIFVRSDGNAGNASGGNSGGTNVGQAESLINTSDLNSVRERLNLPDRFGRISWRELITD